MGTRADFYVGRGETAEWLGSIAWDGYPNGIDQNILFATEEADYRNFVSDFLANRRSGDGTTPDMGWPWPWEDSRTTDYAYAFDGGAVYGSCFAHGWFVAKDALGPGSDVYDDDEDAEGPLPGVTEEKTVVFPNMKDRKNVAIPGSNRSGVTVLTIR